MLGNCPDVDIEMAKKHTGMQKMPRHFLFEKERDVPLLSGCATKRDVLKIEIANFYDSALWSYLVPDIIFQLLIVSDQSLACGWKNQSKEAKGVISRILHLCPSFCSTGAAHSNFSEILRAACSCREFLSSHLRSPLSLYALWGINLRCCRICGEGSMSARHGTNNSFFVAVACRDFVQYSPLRDDTFDVRICCRNHFYEVQVESRNKSEIHYTYRTDENILTRPRNGRSSSVQIYVTFHGVHVGASPVTVPVEETKGTFLSNISKLWGS